MYSNDPIGSVQQKQHSPFGATASAQAPQVTEDAPGAPVQAQGGGAAPEAASALSHWADGGTAAPVQKMDDESVQQQASGDTVQFDNGGLADKALKVLKDPKFQAKAKGVIDKLNAAKDGADKIKNIYTIASSLNALAANPAMDGAEALQHFGELFNATKDLLPSIPGVSQFLDMYGQAIEAIAGAIGQIANNIRKADQMVSDDGGDVAHPGAWPGGHMVFNFMKKLMHADAPMDVPSDVAKWAVSNEKMLILATGEDTGMDFGARGHGFWLTGKPEDMKQWFFKHREAIKQSIYGNAKL